MSAAALPVGFTDVEAAAALLRDVAHRTPVASSRTLNERSGAELFFKCENLQRGGAFKFRGAFNAISQLTQEQRRQGVLTFSSGNHGQAVALVCRLLGVRAVVVMPSDAPRVKVEAVRGYGAEVVQYDRTEEERESLGRRLAEERGLTIVPPYDNPHIVAGQGTCALELFEDVGPLDMLLVPVGGGGLISGCAIAAKALAPRCAVVGVEPEAGDDGARSFRSGRLERVENPQTIADGARVNSLGELNFAIIRACVEDMRTVSDEALVRTMRLLLERMKLLVEPTGCLGAAAALEGGLDVKGKRVGVILSGGNVDLGRLCELFAQLA